MGAKEQSARLSMRVINDRIYEGRNGSLTRFVCECGDLSCWETVSISAEEYTAFRAEHKGAPLLAPRHAITRR
jgi:hypothetical protein